MNRYCSLPSLVSIRELLFTIVLLLGTFWPAGFANSAGALSLLDRDGDPQQIYGGSYALLVGVHDYTNGWADLDQIPAELLDAKEALELHGFQVQLELKKTTAQDLRNLYRNFIDKYGYNRENRLVFIFSGHGHTWVEGNQGYLVGSDAPKPASTDFPGEEFLQKVLHISQMVAWSKQMTAKHALFLFDSCFSGTIFRTRSDATLAQPSYFNLQSAVQPVRQFITAGSAEELVPAKSVFMPVFIDAITTNKADSVRDGIITGNELGSYIESKVVQFADQTPQFGYASYEFSQGKFLFSTPKMSPTQPLLQPEVTLLTETNPPRITDPGPVPQPTASWPMWKKVALGALAIVAVGAVAGGSGGDPQPPSNLTITLPDPRVR